MQCKLNVYLYNANWKWYKTEILCNTFTNKNNTLEMKNCTLKITILYNINKNYIIFNTNLIYTIYK